MPRSRPGRIRRASPPAAESRALHPLIAALAIVVAGTVAYASSFAGAFVLDDDVSIVHNPNLRALWPLSQSMAAPAEATVAGRPVVAFSLAVSYALGGLENAWWFHAVNLAIHLAAAMVLFGIARRSIGRWPALAIALIWCVHPLQTSAVTYVVQRSESLMGLCFLLTLYCAVRAAESLRPAWWTAASVVSCAMGMASKETMVTAPIVVMFWDWVFLRPSDGSPSAPRRGTLYAGLMSTWLILAALMWMNPRPGSIGFGFADWPWWTYLITQSTVILHYLQLSIVPAPLVFDYGWPPARSVGVVLPQLIAVTALAIASFWLLWRRRALGFLGVSIFAILAPTSSVVPIVTEVAAEHRMYLPLAAIVTIAVLGGRRLIGRLSASLQRPVAIAVVSAVVLTFISMTSARNRVYASAEELWADTVHKRPNNARAHNNYAVELIGRGEAVAAAAHFRTALELDPAFAGAAANLGVALCRSGRCAEGIPFLERALRRAPDSLTIRRDLAEAYAASGDHASALRHYLGGLERQPDDVFLLNRAGWLLATSPDNAVRNGAQALALAERAVALTQRRDAVSLDTLAVALAESGKFAHAVTVGTEALAAARQQGASNLIPEMEQRLAIYRANVK